jgi:hypothetical protein
MYRFGAHMGKSEPRAGSVWHGQERGPSDPYPYNGPSLNDVFSSGRGRSWSNLEPWEQEEQRERDEDEMWWQIKQEQEEREIRRKEQEEWERQRPHRELMAKKAEEERLAIDALRLKKQKAERDNFFTTTYSPGSLLRVLGFAYLVVNLEELIKKYPEHAKQIDWDEGFSFRQRGRIVTLRQGLERAISEWDSENGIWKNPYWSSLGILSGNWEGVYFFGGLEDEHMIEYRRIYGNDGNGKVAALRKLKQILLQQGAKPKTKFILGGKKKLAIPEDAPYVDWAKWGATIQDPRGRGGATRKRSKKSRKNMSRKRLY